MPSSVYEDVPYPASPRRETHPLALASTATLFGLRPPPPEGWRVLEVGCSDGGNLLPMAVGLPGARFLGVDLDGAAIERGRALATRAGLQNVDLRAADLRTLFTPDAKKGPFPAAGGAIPDTDPDPFDAIIAHGVFSWVPDEVRRALLALIGRRLAPHGVAYVSWNARPGWRVRGRVRRLLLDRTAHIPDLRGRVRAAREVLARIGDEIPELPAKEIAYLQDAVEDAHIAHDLVSEVNEAFGFRDFLSLAAREGLAYLAEGELSETAPVPPDARGAGGADPGDGSAVGDEARIALEEAFDEARGRAFRRTLLRRATAPCRPALDARSLAPLHVAAWIEAPGDPVLAPLAAAWPRALPFESLVRAVPSQDPEATAARVLEAVRRRRAELHLRPIQGAAEAGERPRASPLARLLAPGREAVPKLRHALVRLSASARALLPLVDGTRDRGALARGLGVSEESVDAALRRLARAGLLIE